jgi:hypothetical protein
MAPASQGSEGCGATGGGGPHDLTTSVAHDGGDSAPEPDSATGVAAVGGALTMIELAVEASSSQTQSRAATL